MVCVVGDGRTDGDATDAGGLDARHGGRAGGSGPAHGKGGVLAEPLARSLYSARSAYGLGVHGEQYKREVRPAAPFAI